MSSPSPHPAVWHQTLKVTGGHLSRIEVFVSLEDRVQVRGAFKIAMSIF
jgi:hypothetical protein